GRAVRTWRRSRSWRYESGDERLCPGWHADRRRIDLHPAVRANNASPQRTDTRQYLSETMFVVVRGAALLQQIARVLVERVSRSPRARGADACGCRRPKDPDDPCYVRRRANMRRA